MRLTHKMRLPHKKRLPHKIRLPHKMRLPQKIRLPHKMRLFFQWLENIMKQINAATELLNIGKGTKQSLSAAENHDEKLNKK